MYHFTPEHPPVPVRLSFRALVPGHVRQYLKQFQIDAIQFMHNFLAKGEFCAYNDETGLGKQAAVAVLLDAACSNKKTLIVVQNDDRYVNGWEFHFSVLTKCRITVIKESKDSTDSPHNVYIAKWSTLRAIDDLTKFDFDFIILDNRGQMLNNSFCTSMLLKNYERKINILISSVDITSDLKLLYNILKLGGRLDPRYNSFRAFEDKFKLPDAKELAFRKVDLEDYFLKRERLVDYCKSFRLRRYCHQFESQLPLVDRDRYLINLELWRERQIATTSESSSVEICQQPEKRVRDTQEMFEEYCRKRRKQQEREMQLQKLQEKQNPQEETPPNAEVEDENDLEIVGNVDDEVAFINSITTGPQELSAASRDISDEAVLMSPLLVVSDSEDPEDVPQICSDDNHIVDLSSDDEVATDKSNNLITHGNPLKDTTSHHVKTKRKAYRKEVDQLKADIATNLMFQNETTPKRSTRQGEKNKGPTTARKRINTEPEVGASRGDKTSNSQTRKCISGQFDSKKTNLTKISIAQKNIKKTNASDLGENSSSKDKRNKSSDKNHDSSPMNSQSQQIDDIAVKKEPVESTSMQTRRTHIKSNILNRIKRELDLDRVAIHSRDMRSMQRLTRSAGMTKHHVKKFAAPSEKDISKTKKRSLVKTDKVNCSAKTNTLPKNPKLKHNVTDTQASIISMTGSQDIEPIQCAQRLSDVNAFGKSTQNKTPEFLVPQSPAIFSRNSLIPSSFTSSNGLFADSDVIFMAPTSTRSGVVSGKARNKKKDDIIILSGSDNENSSSTSRRTRALKPKRAPKVVEDVSKVPTFTQLLAHQNTRASAKSPDLFSNCSDLAQITLSQAPESGTGEPNAPFEGFKIFGSEVKQLQQHYAKAKEAKTKCNGKKTNRDRSCLDILENMFEPANRKQSSKEASTNAILDDAGGNIIVSRRTTKKTKMQTPIVPQHPIAAIAEAETQKATRKRALAPPAAEDELFEITNNGTFGSVMRLHSNGDISPVQQTQKSKELNKITKYFVGGSTQNCTGSQDSSGNNSEAGTPSKRQQTHNLSNTQPANAKKSPKQKCSLTQATKLTKWFTKNSAAEILQGQQILKGNCQDTTKPTGAKKRLAKRRRLDLSKIADDTD